MELSSNTFFFFKIMSVLVNLSFEGMTMNV